MDINEKKIFLIGMNKTGTSTLHSSMKTSKIPSVHSPTYGKKSVAKDLEYFNRAIVFSDGKDHDFKWLNENFDAEFILNTRNKEKWIYSRILHEDGQYLQHISDKLKVKPEKIVEQWKREWDNHHLEVIEYFQARPNDLLIFNIETDHINKLIKFFKNIIPLNPIYYGHKGKSSDVFCVNKLDPKIKLILDDTSNNQPIIPKVF